MLKDFLIFYFWAGLNLQRNKSSASPELHSETTIFRPVLQPLESIPPAGIYSVKEEISKTMGQFFRHLHTTCSFINVTVRFVHRDLRAEASGRENLHQSYRGSGIHSHRAEGQRVWDICLNNLCVSVSVCVGEVPRAIVNTPNCQEISCRLFFRADCSCVVWCDKKTFSFLLHFRRGTLAWTAAGSGSAVTVATRRLFYPSQYLTTQPVCSSPSQR